MQKLVCSSFTPAALAPCSSPLQMPVAVPARSLLFQGPSLARLTIVVTWLGAPPLNACSLHSLFTCSGAALEVVKGVPGNSRSCTSLEAYVYTITLAEIISRL